MWIYGTYRVHLNRHTYTSRCAYTVCYMQRHGRSRHGRGVRQTDRRTESGWCSGGDGTWLAAREWWLQWEQRRWNSPSNEQANRQCWWRSNRQHCSYHYAPSSHLRPLHCTDANSSRLLPTHLIWLLWPTSVKGSQSVSHWGASHSSMAPLYGTGTCCVATTTL